MLMTIIWPIVAKGLAHQTDADIATRGRSLLNRLVASAPIDGAAINSASELLNAGFRVDAARLAEKISTSEDLTSENKFHLARLLDRLDRRAAAEKLLRTLKLEEIAKTHLTGKHKNASARSFRLCASRWRA
jgi:hypothetical protein